MAFDEEDLSLSGVPVNHDLFRRRKLYTAYLGGVRNPEVEAMGDSDLAEVAVRDFLMTMGYDARVLSVARERMPAWDVSWEGLRTIELPEGQLDACTSRLRGSKLVAPQNPKGDIPR